MIDGMPACVSFQPSWRWTKASASSSVSSRRPIAATVSSITRSSAGRPRPITATGSPAGWMATVSMLIAATIDCRRARPDARRNIRRRAGRPPPRWWRGTGCRARAAAAAPSRPAISSIIAMPLALSTAPLQIRSASPSGRQIPKWSQWASSSTLSLVGAAAANPADHIVAGVAGDLGRHLQRRAQRQARWRGRRSPAARSAAARNCRPRPRSAAAPPRPG